MFAAFTVIVLWNLLYLQVESSHIQTGNFTNQNSSHFGVEIYFSSLDSQQSSSILRVKVLDHTLQDYYTFCYAESNSHFALLLHVACRQLGYMTYEQESIRGVEIFPRRLSIRSDSVDCLGHEQTLSTCKWDNVRLESCPLVSTIKCSTCSGAIEAMQGSITNPGYPVAFPYNVYCDWEISVPSQNYLVFEFHRFSLQRENVSPCRSDKPFVEIMSGQSNAHNIRRYCGSDRPGTLKLNHRRAKMRFYSGIFETTESNKDLGFNISFRGKHNEMNTGAAIMIVKIVAGLMLLLSLIVSCYCCLNCTKTKRPLVKGHSFERYKDQRRCPDAEDGFFNVTFEQFNQNVPSTSKFQMEALTSRPSFPKQTFPVKNDIEGNAVKDNNQASSAANIDSSQVLQYKIVPGVSCGTVPENSPSGQIANINFTIYANSKTPPTPSVLLSETISDDSASHKENTTFVVPRIVVTGSDEDNEEYADVFR